MSVSSNIGKFINKNKVPIAVILVIIVVAVFYYRKGKNQVKIQDPTKLPDGSTGGTAGASNDEIKQITTLLYDDMNGWNWAGHKDEPYKRALFFSDADLIKLYNSFNALYQKESGQTLTQWLQSEYFSSDETFGPLLKEKLKKLNCL